MWDFTSHNNTLNEGWCEKLHHITIHSMKGGRGLDNGLCFGEETRARNLVFFRVKWLQPAMKGTSCVRRVRWGRSGRNGFLLCVLQRVLVPVCVVLCMSWICCCRSQWNGCMIVVIWCCHVRREMRVSHVMLQNALSWLHECCVGLVLGRKPEHETLYFSV